MDDSGQNHFLLQPQTVRPPTRIHWERGNAGEGFEKANQANFVRDLWSSIIFRANNPTDMVRSDGVLTPLKNCCFTGALLGDHCGPWDEGGALKGRFSADRLPLVTTLPNAELN